MGVLEDDKAVVVSRPNLTVAKPPPAVGNVSDWLTRRDAGKMLRCSPTKVRDHYVKKGMLHPVCDGDGVWRFNPLEVEQVADEEGIEVDTVESRANAYARLDLMASGKLLRLVTEPMDRIQRYSTDIIDRQSSRIKELEAELDRSRKARELAEDKTHERQVLGDVFREREKRITDLLGRAMVHVDKFFNGGGTPFLHSLNRAQMAMLETVREDFTPEQQAAIDAAREKLGFDKADEQPAEGESK